jgi:hypothetical protein
VLVALARSSRSCRLGRPEVVVFEVAVVRPIGFCRQVPEIGRDIGCDV